MNFAERLAAAVARHGHLCVGLDPRVAHLPDGLRNGHTPAAAVEAFCLRVLDLVRPYTAIIKPQAAFFEQLGPAGMEVLRTVQLAARAKGFLTILDAKRGDIASTAEAYAEAAFSDKVWHADAVTVQPYLGADAILPFIERARLVAGGVFVLVRTSNPGASVFQNLNADGKPLYRHVAEAVNRWNTCGEVGAVVGATHPAELAELRQAMPCVWFLVPGYGVQGGTAADVRSAFPHAIVNSSRAITYPFQPGDADWERKIEAAARLAQSELK